jgi:NAD(P)-dependent dehydrogenase (short-subunit alcohol dehydrogenase family)
VRSVFITGTTSGIGLATTLEFARNGWQVFAGVRNLERAADLRAALDAADLDAELVPADVGDEAQVAAAIEQVMRATDRLDVVVNNAGRVLIAPVEETDDAEARAVFDSNFFGTLNVTRSVVPIMRRQGGGTIVNVSSIGARVAPCYYGIYAATKRAMEALSEAVQLEVLDFGIRVVIIEPGNFHTNILHSAVVARRFGADSPYLDGLRQLQEEAKELYHTFELEGTPGPEQVATAIVAAVDDPDGPFTYAVGADAEMFFDALRDAPTDAIAMEAISQRLMGVSYIHRHDEDAH